MHALDLILYVLAAACFALSAFSWSQASWRERGPLLMPLGLLFWVLVPLIAAAR
jgi:hypothetical protein